MNRALIILAGCLLVIVVLTQVGWLSNGFFGFRVGILPNSAKGAMVAGVAVALLTLVVLKIVRWWKS